MHLAPVLPSRSEISDPTADPQARPLALDEAIARAGERHIADVRAAVFDLDRHWRTREAGWVDADRPEGGAPAPGPPVARSLAIVAQRLPAAVLAPPRAVPVPGRLGGLVGSATRRAVAYLAAITFAELLVALVSPSWGFVAHGAILMMLLVHGAGSPELAERRLLLSLSIAPIIRISSLALPLTPFDRQWWYALVSLPILVSAVVLIRLLGLSRDQLALRLPPWRHWPVTLLVAVSGIPLGFLEYRILRPDALAGALTFESLVLPVVIFVVAIGFTEELLFRGILQATATAAFGVPRGIIYASLLFGVLHIGYWSPVDVVFVFGVALYFAAVVRWTGTLLGVTLAHGLTNVMLFVVLPLILPRVPLP
jgi:membrane protease YdiL (CAAX protease family)